MASKAQIKASNKYNKENTLTVCIRLNKETDKDIIKLLSDTGNKQGLIKNLLRYELDMRENGYTLID